MIGKIVEEMMWVMGTSESARQRENIVLGKKLI